MATPMMPGTAPPVLVRPSRMGACRGDRSAWLQYRPAKDQLPRPRASVMSAAGRQASASCVS